MTDPEPMATFKLVYTPLARQDMLDLFIYIAETLSAPQSATKLLDGIEAAVLRLKESPYSAPAARDAYLATQGYRTLIFRTYLIFYKVIEADRRVVVHRVVYGKRNLAWLFD
jgi:addiction module RelE/StbE family toxin